MAFFFGDGFDLYATITDCGTYWDAAFGSTVTLALSSSGRFAGSRGITNAGASTTSYIAKTSGVNDAVHHISLAIMQTVALSGSNAGIYFSLVDGSTVQCTIGFNSSGTFFLTSGGVGGTVLASYAGAIAAQNTWYQFEVEVVINNTTGSVALRKLGNTVNDFSQGSLNTRGGTTNNYANRIAAGSTGAGAGAQIVDDVLWRSDASSLAWLGDIRCYTRMPASDASVQFTRSGSVAPVTPFPNTTSVAFGTGTGFQPFIASCSGTIGTASMTVATALTVNVKAAIYGQTAGLPATLLATSNQVASPGVGVCTFTFPTPATVVQGTTYYFAYCMSAASGGTLNSTTTATTASLGYPTAYSNTSNYAAFPPAAPTSLSALSVLFGFTVTITPTLLANANMVSEPQQDGANTYVFSSTVGQSDLYNLASLNVTPSSIIGVTTRAYMQKSDAGTRIAAVQLQSGASNVQGSLTLNTTWGWASRNDLVDPATSSAWTGVAVDNVKIGAVVTT